MNTALIVIDMQNGFLSPCSPLYIAGAPATIPACQQVIAFCRAVLVPVFFVTRAYTAETVEKTRYAAWESGGKPLSPECVPELSVEMPFEVLPSDYHLVKPRYSAFFSTGLDLLLRRLGVKRIVLAGTTTPNCIRTTAYDGISLDYDVTVLSDCTSSTTEEIQEANLRDMARVGVDILTAEQWMQFFLR